MNNLEHSHVHPVKVILKLLSTCISFATMLLLMWIVEKIM